MDAAFERLRQPLQQPLNLVYVIITLVLSLSAAVLGDNLHPCAPDTYWSPSTEHCEHCSLICHSPFTAECDDKCKGYRLAASHDNSNDLKVSYRSDRVVTIIVITTVLLVTVVVVVTAAAAACMRSRRRRRSPAGVHSPEQAEDPGDLEMSVLVMSTQHGHPCIETEMSQL